MLLMHVHFLLATTPRQKKVTRLQLYDPKATKTSF